VVGHCNAVVDEIHRLQQHTTPRWVLRR
jgi:hypothetical protein